MGEWTSYALQDFIPFTREVYLRLIERVSETYWPLPVVMPALALMVIVLTYTGRYRVAGLLLALLWGWVGYSFLLQFYANLNWAGHWFAGIFYAQALLLAIVIFSVRGNSKPPPLLHGLGFMLCIAGLCWPLLTLAGRDGWSQVEIIGIHPDPTALFTLGCVLLVLSGWRLWTTVAIPLLWCLISGLTLGVLGLPQAPVLYGVVGVMVVAMVYGALAR